MRLEYPAPAWANGRNRRFGQVPGRLPAGRPGRPASGRPPRAPSAPAGAGRAPATRLPPRPEAAAARTTSGSPATSTQDDNSRTTTRGLPTRERQTSGATNPQATKPRGDGPADDNSPRQCPHGTARKHADRVGFRSQPPCNTGCAVTIDYVGSRPPSPSPRATRGSASRQGPRPGRISDPAAVFARKGRPSAAISASTCGDPIEPAQSPEWPMSRPGPVAHPGSRCSGVLSSRST